MKIIIQINASYVIRQEVYKGKKTLVVPVVMMVEGVHHGSHGPLLHLAEELGRFPEAWNGVPVTVSHPQREGGNVSANSPEGREAAVGTIFNAHMDGGKLKGEAWLIEESLIQSHSDVLAYIQAGRPLDVSIGAFTEDDPTVGEWNGQQYTAIARNHRPDHLALLPGEQGACSWSDGCGIRANQKGGKMKKHESIELWEVLLTNRTDYAELTNSIRAKLDGMDSENSLHFLRALYNTDLVYEVRTKDGSTFYKASYSVDKDGDVTFGNNPETVRRKVDFVSTNADAGATGMVRTKFNNNLKKEEHSMSTDVQPCCPEKVDALIANDQSKFTADDKDWLLTQSAETLEKLQPTVVETTVEVEVTPQINKEQAMQVLKEGLSKTEDFIALMPKELQEQMTSGITLHKKHRKDMQDLILANTKDVWTAADLESMPIETLTKIKSSLKLTNYSPMGTVVSNNGETTEDDLLLPLGVNFKKEGE